MGTMRGCAALVVCSLLWTAGIARAEGEWSIVGVEPGVPTDRDRKPPPQVRVKVVGQAAPTGDEVARWTLKQLDGRLRPVTPSKVTPYHRSSEPLALVVLIEGHEYYFGNDSYVDEASTSTDPDQAASGSIDIAKSRSVGVFGAIRDALDTSCKLEDDAPDALPCAGPPGSKAAIVVYGLGGDVRAPLDDLSKLSGSKLGDQQQQQNVIRRDLAEGLRVAHRVLKQAQAPRKILLVISDGFESGGAEELRAVKRQLDADKIGVLAVQLEVETKYIPDSAEVKRRNGEHMKLLGEGDGSEHMRARTAAELPNKIKELVKDHINDRFWLEFPGHAIDARTRREHGFAWDGRSHDVSLLVDDDELGPERSRVQPLPAMVWGQRPPKSKWWLWLAIPGGGVAVVAGVLLLRGRKPAPPPQKPEEVAPPPKKPDGLIRPVQAAGGAGTNRTIAVNVDGVPVVGWLVPINGPQQFQTFKLGAGVTKIGNLAEAAHIIFTDGYMSAEHAHITMTPNGFTLSDNLSTNGTYVNSHRIDRHELIDNDVIKFGKTECKFKMISGW